MIDSEIYKMLLPDKKSLIVTNEEDPLAYYYWPVIGYFYKKRLTNTLKLFGDKKYGRVLEVGFGSGILFPELNGRADYIYGIETHDKIREVEKMAHLAGVKNCELRQASISNIPYPDNYFDLVFSVSTLEHISELEQAVQEIRRVTKPGGEIISSFPVKNIVTDIFFRLLGFVPSHLHPNSHGDIIRALEKHLKKEKMIAIPAFLSVSWGIYTSTKHVKL